MALELGKKFTTYEELSEYISNYEQSHFVKFWKRDARLIAASRSNSFIRPQLKYCELKYTCIFGGKKFKSTGKNIREVRTFKKENPCQAFISFKPTQDGRFLQIVRFSEEHNHDVSKQTYAILPQQRKLALEVQERARNLVALKANSQVAQLKLQEESDEHLTLRDLCNNPQEKSEKCWENLQTRIASLTERFSCEITVFRDDSNTFRGLFIQSQSMKKTAEAFPEFVGIDTTYKLMNVGIPVFVLTTEDGNCQIENVAICFLMSEDRESIEWFIHTFKEKNSNWQSIKCVITDKEFAEKELVEESFPEAHVSTCVFHSMKTFTRELKNDMYGMNDERRDQILSILQKMIDATSESAFESLYDALKAFAPQNVLIYFYKNWYHIRNQWSMCQGSFKYNFINSSDSRMDSLNAKLKKTTNRKSYLEDFLDALISTLHSLDCKRDYKGFFRQQKRLVTKYDSSSPEKKYMDYLTCEAAKLIINQLEESRKITSDQFVKKDEEFIFKNSEGEIIANATGNWCNCSFNCAMLLPCQHIFLIRRIFDMPLYLPDLVPQRWTVEYYTRNQMLLQQCIDQEVYCAGNEDVKLQESVSKMSFGEKRRKVLLYMNELANTAAQADDLVFEERLQDIKDLLTFWKNGLRTQVVMVSGGEPNLPSPRVEVHDVKKESFDDDYREELDEEINTKIKNEEVYFVVMEKDTRNEPGEHSESTALENDVNNLSSRKRGRPKKADLTTGNVQKLKRLINN